MKQGSDGVEREGRTAESAGPAGSKRGSEAGVPLGDSAELGLTAGRVAERRPDGRRALGAALILTAAVFFTELYLPADATAGIVYVVPLIISLWRGSRRATIRLGWLCAALALVTPFLPHATGGPVEGMALTLFVNRAIVVFSIWASVGLGLLRMEQEVELLRSRRRFQTTLGAIAEAVIATDGEGRVSFLNPVGERLLGWSLGEAVGLPLFDVFRVRDLTQAPTQDPGPVSGLYPIPRPSDAPLTGVDPAGGDSAGGDLDELGMPTGSGEFAVGDPSEDPPGDEARPGRLLRARLRTRDGRELVIEGSRARVYEDEEETAAERADRARRGAWLVIVFRDATGRRKWEESLAELAFRDGLTGLPNRVSLHDRLALELAHARRNREHLALLFLDLDGFKTINDELGHAAGDALLVGVAETLKQCLREGDTVARLGGDEFTVVLPSVGGPRAAAVVAEKIVDALARRSVPWRGHALVARPSIGIALYPDHAADEQQLLAAADQAMYGAKSAGGSSWRFFRPDGEPAPEPEGTADLEAPASPAPRASEPASPRSPATARRPRNESPDSSGA